MTSGAINVSEWLTFDNASLPSAAETINNSTLLQVDIAAIVGVFIFLTIAQFAPASARFSWFMTSFFVVFFAISAIAILVQDIWSTEYVMRVVDYNTNIPEVFALVGFIYFFVVFGHILLKLRKRSAT